MGELSSKLSQLVEGGLYPNIITFLTQLIATVILFCFLKKWVWKPMQEYLAKRSNVIVDELESARLAKEEAFRMKEEYESELKQAKDEAKTIIMNAQEQAKLRREEIIAQAEKEAAYIIEMANKQIEQEKANVEKELKSQVVDLAFLAAEKILTENLDQDKNRHLIDKFLNEVGK